MSRHGPYPGLGTPQSNREQKREAERSQKRWWTVEDAFWIAFALLTIVGILLYNWLPHLRR